MSAIIENLYCLVSDNLKTQLHWLFLTNSNLRVKFSKMAEKLCCSKNIIETTSKTKTDK